MIAGLVLGIGIGIMLASSIFLLVLFAVEDGVNAAARESVQDLKGREKEKWTN